MTDLEREKWNFQKKMYVAQLERSYDLEYVRLTVVIVLLVVIIFYITCKFNVTSDTSGAAEHYTEPQLGLTKNDQKRSDAAFDYLY